MLGNLLGWFTKLAMFLAAIPGLLTAAATVLYKVVTDIIEVFKPPLSSVPRKAYVAVESVLLGGLAMCVAPRVVPKVMKAAGVPVWVAKRTGDGLGMMNELTSSQRFETGMSFLTSMSAAFLGLDRAVAGSQDAVIARVLSVPRGNTSNLLLNVAMTAGVMMLPGGLMRNGEVTARYGLMCARYAQRLLVTIQEQRTQARQPMWERRTDSSSGREYLYHLVTGEIRWVPQHA
jgi:hypothetical protein